MTLEECTKEELIFVIERLQLYNPSDQYYVIRALSDAAIQRDERKYAEARRMSDLHSQKWQEYLDILSPYDGKPLMDVPPAVLERADAAMKEARAADAKWRKLMGFPAVPPAGKKRRPVSRG